MWSTASLTLWGRSTCKPLPPRDECGPQGEYLMHEGYAAVPPLNPHSGPHLLVLGATLTQVSPAL